MTTTTDYTQLTNEELQKEYNKLAMHSGDCAYRLKCFQDDLANLQDQMRAINQESFNRKQAAAAAKPVEAEVVQ